MRKVDVATLSHDELKNVVTLLLKENQQLKKQKKYGLVWEETKEKLDNGDIVPLVKEKKDLRIVKDVTKDTNYLIEGDNYHSLLALQKTHLGKVDVIYIDPPYNTGNEFVYNDKIVDKEDNFRHSKWLSFMHKRLKLAKKLLSEDGVIFVSIDSNELAQLTLLMDEIYGETNRLSIISAVNNFSGRSDSKGFATANEYLLVYSKNKDIVEIGGFPLTSEHLSEYKYQDHISNYKKVGLKKTGKNSLKEDRPNMFYPIFYNPLTKDTTLEKTEGFIEILPYINGREGRWRWGKETFLNKYKTEIIVDKNNKGDYNVYVKMRDTINGQERTLKPKTVWIEPKYDTSNGTALMKNIFEGNEVFNSPKPIEYIKDILKISTKRNSTVLDFFAGSGTTGHAVMELNKEDGGNRKFILCTNNEVSEEKVRQHFINQGLLDKNTKTAFTKFRQENEELVNEFYKSEEYQKLGIARSVTYERLKRVIEGYTTPKGNFVEGLPNNLTYFQTSELFVDKDIDVTLENSSDVQLYNSLYGSDISIMEEIYDIVKLKQEDATTAVIPIEDVYELPDLTSSEYANKTKFVFLLDDGDIEIMQEQIDVIKSEYPTHHIEFDYTSIYMK